MVGEIEKERPKRNMGELGKIGIHEYSQEPFMKSPSKLAHSSSETEDCILTADDVNSNLFTVRAEMMSDTESKNQWLNFITLVEMFNSLLKGQKSIEHAQKDLLDKMTEFEFKLNSGSGSTSSEIQYLRSEIQGNVYHINSHLKYFSLS